MELADVVRLFTAKGEHLSWQRFPDEQVVDGRSGAAIERDEAYFVLRMKEMYLRRTRVLWRKYHPLLHAFAAHGGEEEHAVAGPGQLRDLGDANLERLINLNHRLAGPTPYQGGSVDVLVGLYSIPGEDAAKALVTAIGTIATLTGPALGGAKEIATAVKSSVDSILRLGQTRLRLGVRDSFSAENPLRSGYYIAAAAPAGTLRPERLWLDDGRLLVGEDPIAARPYEAADYFVIAVERVTERDDWRRVPGMADFEARFAFALAEAGDANAKPQRLNDLWPEFQHALASSALLTQPDRSRVEGLVRDDLARRLNALREGGPFEPRSLRDDATPKDPLDYDFLDIDEAAAVPSVSARAGAPAPFA